MNKINLANIGIQTETQLGSIAATLRGFIFFIALTLLILIILLIINWAFSQGTIYSILLKKKPNFRYLKKFLLLNVIWLIPWIILFAIILLGIKITYILAAFYILAFLFLHFSFILYIRFTKNPKLNEIKKTLKFGITKIHLFILPYILIAITFILISQISMIPYFFIIHIIFFSWIQSYIKDITLEI